MHCILHMLRSCIATGDFNDIIVVFFLSQTAEVLFAVCADSFVYF